MLIPLVLSGICLGLMFKAASVSLLPFWRIFGTVGIAIVGLGIAIATVIRGGAVDLGDSVLAVSAMGVSAILSEVILYTLFNWIKNRSNQIKTSGQTINIVNGDPDLISRLLGGTQQTALPVYEPEPEENEVNPLQLHIQDRKEG